MIKYKTLIFLLCFCVALWQRVTLLIKNERLSVLIQNGYVFSLNDENIFIHGSNVRYRKHQCLIEDIWDSNYWLTKQMFFTIVRLFLPDLFIQVVIKMWNVSYKMGYLQVIDRCLLPYWQYLSHLTTVFTSD